MSERVPDPRDIYNPRKVSPADAHDMCECIDGLLDLGWGQEHVDDQGRTLRFDRVVNIERNEALIVAIYEPVPHKDGYTTYTVTVQEQVDDYAFYREYQIVIFPDGYMSRVSEPRITATGSEGSEQELREMCPYDYTQLSKVLALFPMSDAAS